jgi:hypothetical protein
MNQNYIRIGMAVILLGFLFVFFVPVVYSSNLTDCKMPVYSGISPGSCLVLSNPAGLKAIATALFGWGATYGFGEGYSASVGWGTESLTTLGVLIFVVLPMTIASMLILSPEIIRVGASIRKLSFHK